MRRRSRSRERGAELVEFAIAFPTLILMMAGIIDFALLFYSYQVTTNAAREGARLAVLPGYTMNDYATARNRVADYVTTAGLPGDATHLDTDIVALPVVIEGASVDAVRVTVTYTHDFALIGPVVGLINGTFRGSVTYSTVSVMRTEIQPVGP